MNGIDALRMKRRLCHGCGKPVGHTGLLAWCKRCQMKSKKPNSLLDRNNPPNTKEGTPDHE
jgi:predicted amidophosphoribosyltransferase